MLKDHAHKGTGLRGIDVADTSISPINGEEGALQYRGFKIEDLASNYEDNQKHFPFHSGVPSSYLSSPSKQVSY